MESSAPKADLGDLYRAARDCRRVWRWHWERFWILRWENTLRRPSWRVGEEARARRRMRLEVVRYAELRLRIAAQSDHCAADTTCHLDRIQNSLTTIRR